MYSTLILHCLVVMSIMTIPAAANQVIDADSRPLPTKPGEMNHSEWSHTVTADPQDEDIDGSQDIRVVSKTNTSITLAWPALQYQDVEYLIYYQKDGMGEMKPYRTRNTTFHINELQPGNHMFCIRAEEGPGHELLNWSRQTTVDLNAYIDVPQDFRVVSKTNTSITLSWTASQFTDVEYYIHHFTNHNVVAKHYQTLNTTLQINELQRGYHSFRIRAGVPGTSRKSVWTQAVEVKLGGDTTTLKVLTTTTPIVIVDPIEPIKFVPWLCLVLAVLLLLIVGMIGLYYLKQKRRS